MKDQCEYVATTTGDLKKHIESKHKGVIYPYSQCYHTATNVRNLKTLNINMKN